MGVIFHVQKLHLNFGHRHSLTNIEISFLSYQRDTMKEKKTFNDHDLLWNVIFSILIQ